MLEKEKIYIATDGSAVNNGDNTFTCAAGCIITHDVQILSCVKELPMATVNIAELTAVLMALDKIKILNETGNYQFIFVMDSEYTLKSITTWFPTWNKNRKNGVPHTYGGTPVKNFELIEQAYYGLKEIKNKKVWKIRSHVLPKNITKTYHEFCLYNKIEIDLEEFIYLRKINELCDKAVQETTQKMLREKREI